MGAYAFLKSVDFTAFAVSVKTIAPKESLYQSGHAIWWTTMPMALFTFLESYDFNGKQICPLITHGGSGFSNSLEDIARLCPGAVIKEGLAIHGDDAAKSDKALEKWVKKLELL